MSCGIAEFSAGYSAHSLMHLADEAVYEATRSGKHHIVTKATPYIRDLEARLIPDTIPG